MTSVEKRRSGRKSGGHRKHSDGGYSDTSSGGSFLDETDREVSNLTDRAFRSLCIGDEAVYNDSDLSSSSPCAQRDRQLAFNQSGHCRDDRERENLKRASHESFTLRMQQYGQDLIHGGMYGAEIERDPQWEVYGERTQGRVSATFQHSFVETSQQQESLGQEQLSLLSNGATEMSSKQRRSRSRVSSLIRAFNSEGQRDGAVVDGKPREWNDETSWDKSALMSIQRELSEFSTSYQQNFNSGHLPSHGTITSQDPNFYSSNVAAVSHMNSASSFMSSSHTKHSMSAQVNCNSNFFIHSEFSPFKVWRDYNRFPFSQGGVSGFMNCSEFPKWYETPMYKELSLEAQPQGPYQFEERVNRHQRNNLAPVVPPTHQRSTSTSTMMQKAPAVEKRCESELTGHYPHRKRTQSLGTYKLQSKRPSTASPTSEMSRRVQDTISSVKALQQKIKMMTEQNIVTGMTTNQPEGLCSNDNSIIFKNNAESMAPNVTLGTTRKTPFNISHLLTPLVYAHQEAETSEVGQNAVSPQPVEHAPVRAESRGSTPDIKMSSYRSRASSLLFNLKDNRKRVKSTYSPTKFKGLETLEKNIQPSTQEPRDTVIDIPDFPDPDIQVFLVEDSTRTNAASDQYSNHYQSPGLLLSTLNAQPAQISQYSENTSSNYQTAQMQSEMVPHSGFPGLKPENYAQNHPDPKVDRYQQLKDKKHDDTNVSSDDGWRLTNSQDTENLKAISPWKQEITALMEKDQHAQAYQRAAAIKEELNSPRDKYRQNHQSVNIEYEKQSAPFSNDSMENPGYYGQHLGAFKDKYAYAQLKENYLTENNHRYVDQQYKNQDVLNSNKDTSTLTQETAQRKQPMSNPKVIALKSQQPIENKPQLEPNMQKCSLSSPGNAFAPTLANQLKDRQFIEISAEQIRAEDIKAQHNQAELAKAQHWAQLDQPKGDSARLILAGQNGPEKVEAEQAKAEQTEHKRINQVKPRLIKTEEQIEVKSRQNQHECATDEQTKSEQTKLQKITERPRNITEEVGDNPFIENKDAQVKAKQAEAERLKEEHIKAELAKAEQARQARLYQAKTEQARRGRIEAEQIAEEKIKADQVEKMRMEAEQIRTERVKAEHAEAECRKAEQAKLEQMQKQSAKAQIAKLEQLQQQQAKAEQAKLEQIQQQQAKAEKSKLEQIKEQQAKAEQAKLEQIQEQQAKAEQAKLEQIEEQQAKAEQAKLEQIQEQQAKAEKSKLEQIKEQQAKAEQAKLEQIQEQQAKAEQAKLEQIQEQQAKAEQAKLEQIQEQQAKAEQAKLKQIQEQQAKTEQAKLKQIEEQQVKAEQVKLKQIQQQQAKAEQAKLQQIQEQQAKVEQSKLDQIQQQQAKAEQAKLQQIQERQAKAEQAKLEQIQQQQAKAEQAKLQQIQERQAKEEQAKLEEIQGQEAKSEQAKLEQIQERQAKAEQAKLEQIQEQEAKAEQAKLEQIQERQAKEEKAQLEQIQEQQAKEEQAKLKQIEDPKDKAEQAKLEQIQQQQTKADQAEPEYIQEQQDKAEQAEIKLIQEQQTKAEQAEPEQAEPQHIQEQQGKTEQAKLEQSQEQHAEVEQAHLQQTQKQKAQTEQAKLEQTQEPQAKTEHGKLEQLQEKQVKVEQKNNKVVKMEKVIINYVQVEDLKQETVVKDSIHAGQESAEQPSLQISKAKDLKAEQTKLKPTKVELAKEDNVHEIAAVTQQVKREPDRVEQVKTELAKAKAELVKIKEKMRREPKNKVRNTVLIQENGRKTDDCLEINTNEDQQQSTQMHQQMDDSVLSRQYLDQVNCGVNEYERLRDKYGFVDTTSPTSNKVSAAENVTSNDADETPILSLDKVETKMISSPTSRVATDNTQNEEEAGSIKPNELTDSQYFYSESSKEFKLSGSNYLPINEDERSNTDNVTDKVNNDSLEKLKKSDPLKHTDISQKRDSDPPKPFPFERKHKSAERNEGSGKDSHFTPPRALSSKERAQTKQEILTSKIKAHAEKEISAIKEKGFAVRDGFISKNPAKQFSGSQSMIIRQRPPAQDISKTYESTMSSNYNLKHQMEPSGTQIDPIKYFSPPSSATIPVNYAAITSNLSDHEEPMKSNVNGPKTTKNTKDKSYNMSANEGLVENQKKEKQTGIKSPIKSKEQTPQNKEEKKGADQRQNSSLKEKDNLDETEHLNKKKEEPSRAITVVEAESSKPMTTEETESKHEAVQEDSTPSLNNVLGQTKTLVADDSLQITGIMVSVRERKHSMDNGRSNISTLEQINHKDCNNSEGLEVSVGNTSSIEVSMLEPKIEVVRNTYSTKKEDQTKVGMNNHSKNMQETSTLETKLKNESETVTEKKTNLQQESSTIIARPQMVTQCQEPLAEKGVPFTVTVLAKNKVLAESQPLLFKQDIKTNEMKDQTKETAKENSAKSIGKEKVKSSTEQNNLQKGPTTHTNNNFKPKEANSAENNRNDSDDAETLIKHDIQPSGKGDTTTVRNPSKSRNRDGKSAPLMEQNMCDSTPPKPFIKISPSINLTENKNNHVSPTHQYEQTHMGENKQHSENVLIGSIAIRVLPSVTEKDNLKKVEKHSITTILQETQSSLGKKANTLSTEDRSKDLSPTSSEKQAQDSLEEKLAVQSVLSCVKKLSDSLKISNQKYSINIPSDNTQAEKGQPQRVNIRKSVDDLKKQPMVGDYFQVQGVSDTNNGTHCDNTSDAVSKERELSGLLPNEAAISDKSCNEGKHMLDQSEKKTVETSSARVQDNNMKRKSGETEDNLASKQNDGPTERQSNKNEKTEASQAIHMRKHQTVNQPSLSAKDRQRSRNTHPTIEDTDKGKPQVKPKPKERVSTIPEISALADYARLKVIVSEDEANPIQEFPPNKKEGFFPIIQTRHSRRPVFTADAQELPVKQKSVPKKAEVNSKVNKEPKPVVFPITEKEHQRTGMFKLGDKEGQDKMLIDDKANERILDRDSKQAQHLKEKSKSSTNYRQHQRSEEQVAETDNQRLCQEQQSILQSNNAPSLSTTSVNRPRSNSASQHLKPIAISNPPEHVVGEVYSVEEITATPRKDGRIENALANIGEDRTEKRRQEKLPTQHEEIGAQQHRAKQFEETQASRIEEETRAKDMRVKQMIEENRASLAQEERRAAQREEERRTREREAIAAKIKERRERQRAAERRAEEEKASQEKGMIKAKQIKEERRMKEIEENRRTKVEEERRVKLGKEEELLKENEEKSRVRQQEEKAFQEEQQRRAAQVAQQKQQKRAAQVPQEEQQKRAAQVAQEEQQKRAAQEEQQRRAALEQQQKKAAEEEQQRRAAQEEQQRRAALEEQQKRAAQEEQQRRAALEQQQKKAAQEEQQRRVAQEEKQRRASQEKQQKSAALEEQQRRAAQAAQEEQQRRVALEEQQKRAAQEEQQWIAAQVEQQRRSAKEEKRRRAAQEEQQRREALEEQQKRAAQEEQQMRATLTEKQMRAKQIEKEEDARNLEEERFKQIKEQKKADQEIEEQRRDRQKREEWIRSQSEEDERKAVEKEKALIKQRGERKAKEEMTRLIEESQAAIKEEGKRVARDRLQTQREEEIRAQRREEVDTKLTDQREKERATQMEEQKRAKPKMDPIQYYAITSTESEKKPGERQLCSPSPSQQRPNPSGFGSAEDSGSYTRSYRPHAPASPALSLPRSNTSSPALGVKPSMFRVKDNTFRGSSLTKSVKPRLHKSFGEDFRVGSPLERGEEEQEIIRRSAGTPDTGLNRLAAIKESSTFPYLSQDYSAYLPQHRPYSRRSIALDEDDSLSVVSNMSEDVDSCATSATDLADLRGLYDYERPESACSYSSDVSRSLGKPPTVPPKSEKALRRAKRLTTRRIKKEISKMVPDSPVGVEKSLQEDANIPSSVEVCSNIRRAVASPHFSSPVSLAHAPAAGSGLASLHSKHLSSHSYASPHATGPISLAVASPHATAPVSIPVTPPNATGPASHTSALKTVAHVSSSPTLHHDKHPAPVTQYHVESSYPHSYPMTQRKVLQDLGSGQYFVVDVPVQVKTKTFFDPETGKYVQLNVRESGQSTARVPPQQMYTQPQLQPQMQVKVQQQSQVSPASKPFGLYQGNHGYPKDYQAPAINSAASHSLSAPVTVNHNQQTVRLSHSYGHTAPEMGQNSEGHCYSPEKTPYMDTVNDKDKTYNTVYNTNGPYESFPEFDTNSQLARSPVCENDNSAHSQSQPRDIISISELEDFMELSDW